MTATDQSIRQHTSESAAKVIEILRQWKPKHDKYMAGIIAREASFANGSFDAEKSASLDALGDECHELAADAEQIMRVHVFENLLPTTAMDWIYDDYDALMADLADIAHGDF